MDKHSLDREQRHDEDKALGKTRFAAKSSETLRVLLVPKSFPAASILLGQKRLFTPLLEWMTFWN